MSRHKTSSKRSIDKSRTLKCGDCNKRISDCPCPGNNYGKHTLKELLDLHKKVERI